MKLSEKDVILASSLKAVFKGQTWQQMELIKFLVKFRLVFCTLLMPFCSSVILTQAVLNFLLLLVLQK